MTFEHLIRRISPTLMRITHRLNGHHSFFDDEDLYQEALIHLWLHYEDGSLSDKTDSYILQGAIFLRTIFEIQVQVHILHQYRLDTVQLEDPHTTITLTTWKARLI